MRRLVPSGSLGDIRRVWVSDNFTGSGTYADPIDVPVGGEGATGGNVDGGAPDTIYGGSVVIDGGTP